MKNDLQAVIFDMDGVLINSEPLWRRAMIKGFNGFGLNITEDDCRKTMGNRFPEVILYWLNHFEITTINPKEVEEQVMSILYALIETEGRMIDGILDLFDFCDKKGIPTGLATSSSNTLMQQVIKKLQLDKRLKATVSAEYMPYGKPHPEVFLVCAEALKVPAKKCLVIEDSLNGVIAAKAAEMKVIAVPDEETKGLNKFILVDYHLNSMPEVLGVFKQLWP